MQLTNICRDVQEDWGLGRLYLPSELLLRAGARRIPDPIGGPFPQDPELLRAIRQVTSDLLLEADRYYDSADRGIAALPFAAGLAVRAARTLYHAIGGEIRANGCDPRRGRAVVPGPRKLVLALSAFAGQLGALPSFARERAGGRRARPPQRQLDFPEELLPKAAPASAQNNAG
jgi:phytoene synthase